MLGVRPFINPANDLHIPSLPTDGVEDRLIVISWNSIFTSLIWKKYLALKHCNLDLVIGRDATGLDEYIFVSCAPPTSRGASLVKCFLHLGFAMESSRMKG